MGNHVEIRHAIGADGMLLLRTISGNIKLTATDGPDAVVLARSSSGEPPELSVERGAGRLLVEPPRAGLSILRRREGDIDFEVTLPRGARVDVKSVGGDIRGNGLEGEQDYKSVSGDVRLARSGGRLTILSVSGAIRLDGGRKLELSATTTSGDVTIEAELVDFLRARTVTGDVRITGRLSDGPRHTVETVSGDLTLRSTGGVTVEPSRALDIGRGARRPVVIGDGRAQLSFRSMSGEARVTTAAGYDAGEASDDSPPTTAETRPATTPATRLDVLRALERGEIDIEEAARRLEEVGADA